MGRFSKNCSIVFRSTYTNNFIVSQFMVVFSFPFLFFFFSIPLEGIQKKNQKRKKNTHTTTNCMTTTLVGSRMLWMPVSVITDCKTANTNNLLELQQKPKNFFFLSLEKKINEKEFFFGAYL